MSLQEKFDAAAAEVKNFTKKPSNEELLELYALFKQATKGDNNESQPWAVQVEARAKHDAWAAKKGLSSDDAKTQYVALVDKLRPNYA